MKEKKAPAAKMGTRGCADCATFLAHIHHQQFFPMSTKNKKPATSMRVAQSFERYKRSYRLHSKTGMGIGEKITKLMETLAS